MNGRSHAGISSPSSVSAVAVVFVSTWRAASAAVLFDELLDELLDEMLDELFRGRFANRFAFAFGFGFAFGL